MHRHHSRAEDTMGTKLSKNLSLVELVFWWAQINNQVHKATSDCSFKCKGEKQDPESIKMREEREL